MGFLKKLFGSPNPEQPPESPVDEVDEIEIPGNGNYDLEVVGESHYQTTLEEICGERKKSGENLMTEARLLLEDDNRFDKNAVSVQINGKTVGYLSKEVAIIYRGILRTAKHPKAVGICKANIRGGWLRKNGDKGNYGVWLDIPVEA